MQRLNYVDYSKGLAILLVVIGHLCQYNFEGVTSNRLFYFIYSFHMPLFFFLSGYVVTMSHASLYDYKSFIIRKIQTLLIPFFCWSLFAEIIQNGYEIIGLGGVNRFIQLILDPQTGAWFLIVLFCIQMYFITGIAISRVLKRFGNNDSLFEVIALIIVAAALYVISRIVGGSVYISLQYFLMFVVGYLFNRLFNGNLNQLALLTCILLYSFLWKEWNGTNNSVILRLGISIPISMVILYLFKLISSLQNRINTVILNGLQYIGRHSLDIYLTHSFFFLLFCKNINVDTIQPVLLFFILLLLAIPICYFSIILASVLKQSNVLALLLFGKSKK